MSLRGSRYVVATVIALAAISFSSKGRSGDPTKTQGLQIFLQGPVIGEPGGGYLHLTIAEVIPATAALPGRPKELRADLNGTPIETFRVGKTTDSQQDAKQLKIYTELHYWDELGKDAVLKSTTVIEDSQTCKSGRTGNFNWTVNGKPLDSCLQGQCLGDGLPIVMFGKLVRMTAILCDDTTLDEVTGLSFYFKGKK